MSLGATRERSRASSGRLFALVRALAICSVMVAEISMRRLSLSYAG